LGEETRRGSEALPKSFSREANFTSASWKLELVMSWYRRFLIDLAASTSSRRLCVGVCGCVCGYGCLVLMRVMNGWARQ
jgi:hypothetical protein